MGTMLTLSALGSGLCVLCVLGFHLTPCATFSVSLLPSVVSRIEQYKLKRGIFNISDVNNREKTTFRSALFRLRKIIKEKSKQLSTLEESVENEHSRHPTWTELIQSRKQLRRVLRRLKKRLRNVSSRPHSHSRLSEVLPPPLPTTSGERSDAGFQGQLLSPVLQTDVASPGSAESFQPAKQPGKICRRETSRTTGNGEVMRKRGRLEIIVHGGSFGPLRSKQKITSNSKTGSSGSFGSFGGFGGFFKTTRAPSIYTPTDGRLHEEKTLNLPKNTAAGRVRNQNDAKDRSRGEHWYDAPLAENELGLVMEEVYPRKGQALSDNKDNRGDLAAPGNEEYDC